MTTQNPSLLACGHLVTGFYDLRWDGPTREIRCPEGCGWQAFVRAPDLDFDDLGPASDTTKEER